VKTTDLIRLRAVVRRRDNHTCQECGRKHTDGKAFVTHHREPGIHTVANLVTLCVSCHRKAHGGPRQKRQAHHKASIWYDHAALERARLVQGLTYQAIAERTGLSQPTVARCCKGESANPPTIKRVADVLGIALADIVVAPEQTTQAKS